MLRTSLLFLSFGTALAPTPLMRVVERHILRPPQKIRPLPCLLPHKAILPRRI